MKPKWNDIVFEQPEKVCPKCGAIIPQNGWLLDKKQQVVLDANGHGIGRSYGQLACEACALAAMPAGPPRPKRLRRGETAEGQMVIEAPSIRIS